MSDICLFHCAESSPFCNSYYLFTLLFLSKQTRHGRKIVSFYFFLFICGRAKCLSREQSVGSWVQELPFDPVAVCSLTRTVTGSFEGSWTISECGNEKTHNHESRTPYGEVWVASRGQEIVSVASRVVNPKHDELRPALSKELVASKDMGIQNVQQLEGSYTVLLYFTLYVIICTHTELLNDIDHTVVISCYCMFKPY